MIEPAPRYAELLRRRDHANAQRRSRPCVLGGRFSRSAGLAQARVGRPVLRRIGCPRQAALIAKGRGFTEDDKRILRDVELAVLRPWSPSTAAPPHAARWNSSASPFYHPILPLLCDTDVYLRTHPHSRMPRQRFRHPDDARDAARTGGPVAPADVRREAGRACGRPKGRYPTRWCRWRRIGVPLDGD